MTDVLLNQTSDDFLIKEGDFVMGKSQDQEISLVLRISQGELKEDPVLGPGLIKFINSYVPPIELRRVIRQHLARDNKNYDSIKNHIKLKDNASN